MFKNKLGEDSPIQKCIHLKIRRRDGFESFTTLEEGEFQVPIDHVDGCINHLYAVFHCKVISMYNRMLLSVILRSKTCTLNKKCDSKMSFYLQFKVHIRLYNKTRKSRFT